MTPESRGIHVRVPATVANLGPGFDCLGVALGIHLEVLIAPSEAMEMVGGDPAIALEENLTYRAYVRAFAEVGGDPPPARVEVLAAYPHARGMGSSASAIVAGLVGARALGGLGLGDPGLAALAVQMEGHADNVLPALFGGLILAAGPSDASGRGWIALTPAPDIVPILLVAPHPFTTLESREILPDEVTRADAVANAAATAALVAVLGGLESPAGLMAATADRLHERFRLPLMPDTAALHKALRTNGVPAALAGAGPSLIALVGAGELDAAHEVVRSHLPHSWHVLTPGWDLDGAQVRSSG